MIRSIIPVAKALRPLCTRYVIATRIVSNNFKSFSLFSYNIGNKCTLELPKQSLLQNDKVTQICNNIAPISVRTVTKFSLKRGKRKTVKAAINRFFRLHWGGWIRTRVGRHKKMWKKSQAQKRRLRQHVFCNATQSTLLDKMVTKFWKKPKYYVDDPYEPYHTREEFKITRRKPL